MNPPPNFDRLAKIYRVLELASFGPWLWRCRSTFLDELARSRRALVLGDGDGRFTARLLRNSPQIHVHAIDASPEMLRALVRRAGPDASRLSTQVADARHWEPAQTNPYDLVVTHFFLDCLTTAEICTFASRMRPFLTQDAIWVVSEFAVPQSSFGRLIARPVVATLYRVFGLLTGLKVDTLPDHRAALEQSGFLRRQNRTWLRGLLVSELWTAN